MVAPILYVGAGTAVVSTGSNSCSPPIATQPGDFLLLLIETANQSIAAPSGWNALSGDSPQGVGTGGSTGATRITAYYRWADAPGTANGASVADSGDHTGYQILAFRGVRRDGSNPWDVTSGNTSGSSDTSVSVPGATTTVDQCLVLAISAFDTDGTNPVTVAWANSDLTDFATPSGAGWGSATGNGGGINIAAGVKTSAGTYGASTATLTTSTVDACLSIALAPSLAPWFRAVSAGFGSGAAVNVPWPSGHQADDVGILVVETENQSIAAPSGWAEVASSPQGTGTGGTAGSTRLTVFWRRATSSSESDAALGDSGDHQIGALYVFRNVTPTGDPWDVTTGGVEASATTTVTMTGVTTSVDDTLILAIASFSTDISAGTPQMSGWTNATLASLVEIFEFSATVVNGGGMGVACGVLADAGASGTSTVTLATSSRSGWMTIALRPTAAGGGGARSWAYVI